MPFTDLIDSCGSKNIPGVSVRVYFAKKDDIDTFPPFKITTLPGDSVTLDGDIVMKALKKFYQVDIITDSGEVKDTLAGSIGSKVYESTFDFMKATTNPNVVEFQESLANECLVVIVKEKSGNLRVLGNLDSPAYLETAEGTTAKTTGDTRGFTNQIKATPGYAAPFYEGLIDIDDLT